MLSNREDAVLLVAVTDGHGREHVLVGREVDVRTLWFNRHSDEIQLKHNRANMAKIVCEQVTARFVNGNTR